MASRATDDRATDDQCRWLHVLVVLGAQPTADAEAVDEAVRLIDARGRLTLVYGIPTSNLYAALAFGFAIGYAESLSSIHAAAAQAIRRTVARIPASVSVTTCTVTEPLPRALERRMAGWNPDMVLCARSPSRRLRSVARHAGVPLQRQRALLGGP
jgi:nucleotide-binding universal stress UspA family protein